MGVVQGSNRGESDQSSTAGDLLVLAVSWRPTWSRTFLDAVGARRKSLGRLINSISRVVENFAHCWGLESSSQNGHQIPPDADSQGFVGAIPMYGAISSLPS